MSVRRLAEPAVQPAAFAFTGKMVDEVQRWIAKYPKGREQSAIIPLLMLAQEQEGWVTRAAIGRSPTCSACLHPRAGSRDLLYAVPVAPGGHEGACAGVRHDAGMLRGAEDLISLCKSKIHPNLSIRMPTAPCRGKRSNASARA